MPKPCFIDLQKDCKYLVLETWTALRNRADQRFRSDRYGLSVCLEDLASTDVPKPRDEELPSTGLFGSAYSGDTQRPLVPPPVSTNLFSGFSHANAPRLFGSKLPSGPSFGLRPAIGTFGTFGTSTFRPSTSSAFAELYRSGAPPVRARPELVENIQPFLAARDMNGFSAVSQVYRPAETTASPSSTQPWFGVRKFGATPPSETPQPTKNQTPQTSAFSSPNPDGSTRRTEHLQTYDVDPSSATPSACSLERDPRPMLHAGQTCTRCKVVHLQRGWCDCDQSPPPSKIFGKQ